MDSWELEPSLGGGITRFCGGFGFSPPASAVVLTTVSPRHRQKGSWSSGPVLLGARGCGELFGGHRPIIGEREHLEFASPADRVVERRWRRPGPAGAAVT